MNFIKSLVLLSTVFLSLTTFAGGDHYSPVRPPDGDWNEPGLSLQYLAFWFTGPGCFVEGQPYFVPGHVVPIIQQGAVMVETTQGYRLMVPYDPIYLTRFARRNQLSDMIASGPNGVGLYPRYSNLPNGYVEIFQRPMEAGLCNYGY